MTTTIIKNGFIGSLVILLVGFFMIIQLTLIQENVKSPNIILGFIIISLFGIELALMSTGIILILQRKEAKSK